MQIANYFHLPIDNQQKLIYLCCRFEKQLIKIKNLSIMATIFNNFYEAKRTIENFTDSCDKFEFKRNLEATLTHFGEAAGMYGFLNSYVQDLKDLCNAKCKELAHAALEIERQQRETEGLKNQPNPTKLNNMIQFANEWLDGQMVASKENYQKAKRWMNQHHAFVMLENNETSDLLHRAFCGISEFYNYHKV